MQYRYLWYLWILTGIIEFSLNADHSEGGWFAQLSIISHNGRNCSNQVIHRLSSLFNISYLSCECSYELTMTLKLLMCDQSYVTIHGQVHLFKP